MAAWLVGVGSNEGSVASAQSGAGAEKIAATLALAVSIGVEAWSALTREPTSSIEARARKVDLSFMRVSFEGRFTKEPRRVRRLLKREGALPPL
jgi:hypothetical protein